MRKIKVGIIGTGFIAEAHIEAVRRLGYVEVLAVSGSSKQKADEFAKKHHILNAYGTYQELLNNNEIEVVHNCTPNKIHHEVNIEVIRLNKHILSEKPLTLNAKESKELIGLLDGKNVVHGVNFNYRQYPLIQHLKASVDKKELGDVHLVHGNYLQDWMLYETDFNWRVDPKIGGELRAIGDIGSHWIDLLQYILGKKVVKVFADLNTLYPTRKEKEGSIQTFSKQSENKERYHDVKIETEDFGLILLEFEGGIKGSLTVSQVSAGRKNHLEFELNGKWASASWNQEEPEKLWIGQRGRANQELMRDPSLMHQEALKYAHYPGGHGEAWADGMKNMMAQFYQAVLEGKNVNSEKVSFATFHDGHQMMRVLDAILESAKKQTWVQVDKGE